MTVAGPAGVWRNTQSSALQVDAETSLWAVGRAVAVAGLTVAHHLMAPHQSSKSEIVTCERKRNKPNLLKNMEKKRAYGYKTGFTVDTQTGDIQPDFVEGGGSR